MGLYSLSNKKGCASDHQIPGVPAKENIGQMRFRAAIVLGMFVTRPEVCIFAPKTTCSQQSAVSLCVPEISHLTLTLVCGLDLAVEWFEL